MASLPEKDLSSGDVLKDASHTLSSQKLTSCPANLSQSSNPDPEKQEDSSNQHPELPSASKSSAFNSLGLLDRFLALWIFLAMAIGIILGNFVPNTATALQKGTFVGVSVPIGMYLSLLLGDVGV
jgi:ACR3 family arsenite transporter